MSDKPFVLIEVSGGVAEETVVGNVETAVLDWDNIEAETSPEILGELLAYAAGVADAVEVKSPQTAKAIREHVAEEGERLIELGA